MGPIVTEFTVWAVAAKEQRMSKRRAWNCLIPFINMQVLEMNESVRWIVYGRPGPLIKTIAGSERAKDIPGGYSLLYTW